MWHCSVISGLTICTSDHQHCMCFDVTHADANTLTHMLLHPLYTHAPTHPLHTRMHAYTVHTQKHKHLYAQTHTHTHTHTHIHMCVRYIYYIYKCCRILHFGSLDQRPTADNVDGSRFSTIRMQEYILVLVHNLYLSHLNHCQVTLLYIIFLQVVLVVLSWDGKARTFVCLQFVTVNCIYAIQHMQLQHVVKCWRHKETFYCTHKLCHGWRLACRWCHRELDKGPYCLACNHFGKDRAITETKEFQNLKLLHLSGKAMKYYTETWSCSKHGLPPPFQK